MRIFSAVRPSGEIHIGNYLGAVKQWIELQEKHDCVFSIADLHATTTPYKPELLQKRIFELTAAYLAAGIDPKKCILFVQSQVKEHTELAWLLGTITPMGELKRMTQFKEKSKSHPDYVNAGLFNYPLLMASDILLYKTDLVPVGKDQQQHVELTREIARKFNHNFGNVFKEPKVLLSEGQKIMSLQNPRKKMSKTDDLRGCIEISDAPEEIQKKIMAAVTDTGKIIKYDPERKPGISNLLLIYSLFTQATAKGGDEATASLTIGKTIKEVEKQFKNAGYEKLKKSLSKLVIDSLEPFQRKQKELLKREVYIKEILNQGAARAKIIAQTTMEEVRKKMGLN